MAATGQVRLAVVKQGPGTNPGNADQLAQQRGCVAPRATRARAEPRQHPVTAPTICRCLICAQQGPGPNPGNAPAGSARTRPGHATRNEGRGRAPATPTRRLPAGCAGSTRNEGRGGTPATPSGSHRSFCQRRATRNEGRGRIPATPRYQPGSRSAGAARNEGLASPSISSKWNTPPCSAQRGPGRTPATLLPRGCWSGRRLARNEGRDRSPATPDGPGIQHAMTELRATRARAEPGNAHVDAVDGREVHVRTTRTEAEPRQRGPRRGVVEQRPEPCTTRAGAEPRQRRPRRCRSRSTCTARNEGGEPRQAGPPPTGPQDRQERATRAGAEPQQRPGARAVPSSPYRVAQRGPGPNPSNAPGPARCLSFSRCVFFRFSDGSPCLKETLRIDRELRRGRDYV
jgi:hypothetical protein